VEAKRYGLGAVGSGLFMWRVQAGLGYLSGAPSLFLLANHKLVVRVSSMKSGACCGLCYLG
jgi:hypothetical protein